jgi:hypothetical protein
MEGASMVRSGDSSKKKVYTAYQTEEQWQYDDGQDGDEEEDDEAYVADFEEQMAAIMGEDEDTAEAFATYREARQRIADRKVSRGFWPTNKGQHSKGSGKKGGNRSLAERIAASTCAYCNEKGHWKNECPKRKAEQRGKGQSADVHFAQTGGDDQEPDVVFFAEAVGRLIQLSKGARERLARNSGDRGRSSKGFLSASARERLRGVLVRRVTSSPTEQSDFHNRPSFCKGQRTGESRPKGWTFGQPCLGSGDGLQEAFWAAHGDDEAIIDTGATRNVMGSKVCDALIKGLPHDIRCLLTQEPSAMVFKFGNNQVLRSQYRIALPL